MRFLVGQVIAQRYRVENLIGTGSGGEIYKVWDEKRSAYLALKLLRPEWSHNPELLARFEEEARSLAKLQHPNIVRYYEMVHEDGLAFFLMDFIQGVTLRKLLKEESKTFSLSKILSIMDPMCKALNYAHEQDVIHCDVKPENIIIDQNENVFLTDFGIAHTTETNTDIIRSAGTPAYMAPEQIQKSEITPQTDIYALGVILYEMFTGRKPFSGDSAPHLSSQNESVKWEQQYRMPTPPDQIVMFSGINPSRIVLKCLEKNPRNRYLKTVDLLDALKKMQVEDDTFIHKRVEPDEQTDDVFNKKNKAVFVIMAGIAVIVTVLGLALASVKTPTSISKTNSISAQYNACMEVDLGLQEKSTLIECVTSVDINDDGFMQVNFRWELVSVSPAVGVTIQADTNNQNMYVLDDLGNRWDHIATGGGTDQSITLKPGSFKEGWFLFPALPSDAKGFFFVDEDNQVRTALLMRKW
ncbi:MAG: serine/threonine-protein kinase [Anaerolineaceae bacterium]